MTHRSIHRRRLVAAVFAATLVFSTGAAWAHGEGDPDAGLKADLLSSFESASTKLVDLAEAMSAEQFAWRPADGVRSVSETLMHVAVGNYFIPNAVGLSPPEGVQPPPEMEKITDKAEVIGHLKKSIEHAKQALESTSDLDAEVDFFGNKASKRRVLLVIADHAHEHLGQMIAYARSNGVAPPWSGGGN